MKKIKLFLSLCMMCLSVAVLCMGILAANSATYNINGNISYNMIDSVALVNTRVYKVAGTETDLSTKCTELSSKSFEEIERISDPYYILSQKLDSQPLINTSNETYSSKTTSVNIVYGAVDSGVEYYTYYVVIQIRNMSTDTGYVLNAYLETVTTPKKSSVTVNATSDNVVCITSGSYSNVIVALTYNGTSTDKDEDSFSYTLNLTYGSGWIDKTFSGTYNNKTYSITLNCCQGKTWSEIKEKNSDLEYYENSKYFAVSIDVSAALSLCCFITTDGTSSGEVLYSDTFDSQVDYSLMVRNAGGMK